MPELPEVEVVRAGLEAHVTDLRIRAVTVLDPRAISGGADHVDAFVSGLIGCRLGAACRRGKYLWLPLDRCHASAEHLESSGRDALVAHLGMSGQFRVDAPEVPLERHTRVVMDLGHDVQLRFIDQRLFGSLGLSVGDADLPAGIAHIALDPFDPGFDLVTTAAAMKARRSTVKRALLDQRLVSGIGNIYADEALWRARTHFDHPTQDLSTRRARNVLRCAHDVMAEALAAGGTSFDALYVHVDGHSGYFSRGLSVYGREGEPCPRCGHAIVRRAFMNRSSYLCPSCQRLPKPAPAMARIATNTASHREGGRISPARKIG